jgi:hypothetical protein
MAMRTSMLGKPLGKFKYYRGCPCLINLAGSAAWRYSTIVDFVELDHEPCEVIRSGSQPQKKYTTAVQ